LSSPGVGLKEEHQSVLDSINQALRLVESTPLLPAGFNSSPTTSRLRDRISAACASTPPRQPFRPSLGSSPLTPSVEKSHITFDILRDLENQSTSRLNQQQPLGKSRHVHFSPSGASEPELDLSQASQEYLKKYNLLQ